MFILGAIMGVMTTARLYLRDGGACIEDLQSFPVSLKRKLVILECTGWALLLAMVGLIATAELELI